MPPASSRKRDVAEAGAVERGGELLGPGKRRTLAGRYV